MNPGPLRPRAPVVKAGPPKHVIHQYRHRAQQVICICGWEGSTASRLGEPSDWTLHVRASKAALL